MLVFRKKAAFQVIGNPFLVMGRAMIPVAVSESWTAHLGKTPTPNPDATISMIAWDWPTVMSRFGSIPFGFRTA